MCMTDVSRSGVCFSAFFQWEFRVGWNLELRNIRHLFRIVYRVRDFAKSALSTLRNKESKYTLANSIARMCTWCVYGWSTFQDANFKFQPTQNVTWIHRYSTIQDPGLFYQHFSVYLFIQWKLWFAGGLKLWILKIIGCSSACHPNISFGKMLTIKLQLLKNADNQTPALEKCWQSNSRASNVGHPDIAPVTFCIWT